MATEFVKDQAATEEITAHVIWMTTGLGCDGDSVAMTSATNPSLEDIVQGVIPGMPKVVIHTPVLAYETGAEFMQAWYDAEAGKLDPFVLILEGSIPNEKINGEGHWAGMGVNPENGQPITTNEWIDRLAPKAAAVVAVGTCATYGGIPAMKNNPTGAMGLPDYLGWKWKSKAGLPVVCLPGCPTQPDNTTEALLYLVLHLGGMAPVPDLDDQLRPTWLYGRTVHESCNRGAFYEMGDFATEYGSRQQMSGQARLQGAGGQVQRARPRLGERNRRLPERGRHLHGLHDAGVPRQVHALHGGRQQRQGVFERRQVHLRTAPALGAAVVHQGEVRQGTGLAAQQARAHQWIREALVSAESLGDRRTHGHRRDTSGTQGRRQGDVLGPDHPHRRVARDPHGDRLQQPAGPQVLQHVDDLPRVRHLHEGDRSSRHPLHHQPHLRHLW